MTGPTGAAGTALTAETFEAIPLRETRREELEQQLGSPVREEAGPDGASCLDYAAATPEGGIDPVSIYRFCFDSRGRLNVRTTITSAP